VGGNDQMLRALLAHFPNAPVCHIGLEDTVDDIVTRLAEAAPQPIDHLLWLCAPATGQGKEEILPYFRTVKALLQLGYGSRSLGWTVITTGALAVHQSESVNPSQAALHGLIGAMAKEHHNWRVRLVDIGSSDTVTLPPLAELFTLLADPNGDAWACRFPSA